MAERKKAKKSAKTAEDNADAGTAPAAEAGPAPEAEATPVAEAAPGGDAIPGIAPQARLPLFYRDPRPVNSDRHGGKSVSTRPDYSFAAKTNSIPITANECTRVMRHYPIVFTRGEPVMPVAVVGLRDAINDFVASDGQWAPNCYVPAYVRRYPFILLESPDRLQYTLCIDEGSNLLIDGDEQPLFANGEPTEFTNNALRFCSAYQGQNAFTLEFTAALEKYGLLIENRADVSLKSGERLALSGFRMVDEAKFANLPDDVFLDWRQRGWVLLVYCHLLSMGNWQALVEQLDEVS